MIVISPNIAINDDEIDWQAIRASGPGGQHVNKTSTAMQLIFDIRQSSLPEAYKAVFGARGDQVVAPLQREI